MKMLKALGLGALVTLSFAPVRVSAEGVDPQQAFWQQLHGLCGARFEGETTFPDDPGEAFRDQLLVAVVESCTDEEIRVPFTVGEDRSRTWILRQVEGGLELKHDHRHEDGTPDEVTMYGGTTSTPGTAHQQAFPADAHTAALIPEASTNVWQITLSEDGQTLTYYLERHSKPRFKAVLTLQ